MRHIVKLEEITSDDVSKFHTREQAVVDHWAKMVSTEATPQTNGAATNEAAAPKSGANPDADDDADADALGDATMDVDVPGEVDAKTDTDAYADAEVDSEKVDGVVETESATMDADAPAEDAPGEVAPQRHPRRILRW